MKKYKKISDDKLILTYLSCSGNLSAVARKLQCCPRNSSNRLRKLGFNGLVKGLDRKHTPEKMLALYSKHNGNYTHMSYELKTSQAGVTTIMKKLGLRSKYPAKGGK